MAEMRTNAGALRAAAANFDQISVELQQVIRMVEATGGELAGKWRGKAGKAAQEALRRFHEAGQAQISALTDISGKVDEAGIQYSKADDDQSAHLAAQMKF
ncbi:WXG100 family type VII secretion target [Mycobacterium sp. ML4]